MTPILPANIGGINSRFGRFEVNPGDRLEPAESHWAQTSKASSFPNLLSKSSGAGFTLQPGQFGIGVFAVRMWWC
jgi:hypothetical protein